MRKLIKINIFPREYNLSKPPPQSNEMPKSHERKSYLVLSKDDLCQAINELQTTHTQITIKITSRAVDLLRSLDKDTECVIEPSEVLIPHFNAEFQKITENETTTDSILIPNPVCFFVNFCLLSYSFIFSR